MVQNGAKLTEFIKQGQLLWIVIVDRCGSLSIVLDLWGPAGPPSELWISTIGYVFHMHQFHQQVLVTPCLMATLIHILVPVFLCYSIVYNLLNKLQLVPLWKVIFCASEPSYKASVQLWWGKSCAWLESSHVILLQTNLSRASPQGIGGQCLQTPGPGTVAVSRKPRGPVSIPNTALTPTIFLCNFKGKENAPPLAFCRWFCTEKHGDLCSKMNGTHYKTI